MHFLITAGPTREYIDSVRFLSNASTGRMGFECAAAAVRRGHTVTLVTGPTHLESPRKVRCVPVVSARQMHDACRAAFGHCDAVIMTAAVADYRPRRTQRTKRAKQGGPVTLELTANPDILASLGRAKQGQVLIGFALQDTAGRQRAREKLAKKNLDAIVLNTPAALGAKGSQVELLTAGGQWRELGPLSKRALATRLVRLAERLAKRQSKAK